MPGGLTPKVKRSRSNTRHRRAQWKATATPLVQCESCRQPKRAHQACSSCGAYKGRHYPEAIVSGLAR